MQQAATVPYRVDDWSGGITDNYLNGAPNCSLRLDNVLIDRNRKFFTRWGSEVDDELNFEIPAGQQRISKLIYHREQLFKQSARNLYYVAGGVYETLVGPTSNPVFGAGTTASHVADAEWQKIRLLTIDEFSTPRVIYKDGSSAWQTRTLGLPALASNPSVALTAGASSLSYGYAYVHCYTFSVGTVSHVWRSAPVYVTAAAGSKAAIAGGAPASHTNIPVLANGSTENYATTVIKIEVYRTENAGTEYRKVGEVTNGTTTFSDTTSDGTAWAAGIRLYTSGGVYDADQPPPAKYVEVVNGTAWFGHVREGSEERPNRLRQAITNAPYFAPTELYVDLDDDCTGLSSVDVYLLAFERNKLWRIEGSTSNLGVGVPRKRIVSNKVGTVSHNSIVKTKKGVYFAAEDGFYFTDGFEIQRLTEHLLDRFKERVATAVMEKRIQGAEDPKTGRVYWTMQSSSTATDCDEIWVLDPNFGLRPESTFTTWSDGVQFGDNFFPTAITFIGGSLYRANHKGHCFYHTENFFTDAVVDLTVDADEWETRAVIWDYISCASAFGDEVNKKYAPSMQVVAKNETNVSVLVQSINDDAGTGNARDLKEIRFRNNFVWGDPDIVWGDPSIVWNFAGAIVAQRTFPAGSLRFLYKQIRMTNSETVITKSDDYGLATVDSGALTAELVDAATRDWPESIVGMKLYFGNDGYEEGFEIAARSADTLTLLDPDGSLPDGDQAWELKGYRKGERFSIQSYTINYLGQGESTPGYRRGDDGRNA